MNSLVSIVMPSYNTGMYIAESIKSVIAQTYQNWELLIVDDCSTDDTVGIVQSFNDERIRLFVNEVNSGAAVSRNRALREAKGKWIAFLDSDDLWLPDKLEKQIDFMEKNGYAFSYTRYAEINESSEANGVHVSGPKHITKRGMYRYCWPGCLTIMYNADVVGLILIECIQKNNDYAMWLKVSRKADCYLLDEELAQYRRGRSGSISSHKYTTMIKWHYKLFREAEHECRIPAAWHTFQNMFFGVWKKLLYVQKDHKTQL